MCYKRNTLLVCLLLTVNCTAISAIYTPSDYPSIWECDNSKFNWYCDEEPESEKKEQPVTVKKEISPEQKISPKKITDATSDEEAQKILSELRFKAAKTRTDEDIRAFLEALQWVSDTSSTFADATQRFIWKTPQYDYSLRSPTTNYGAKLSKAKKAEKEAGKSREISKTHGIFFFFRSDCPYCHALAPLVKNFSENFGVEIVPISLDGKGLPQFPNPKHNNTAATNLNVTTVPALFLVGKEDRMITPISYGAITYDDMIERIFVITSTKPGDRY